MSHKPQPAPPLSFALPDHAVLAITGRDALAFAQAQFMNDVTALDDGQWQWNGWLNAKGRLIALFALLRLDAETLWLLLADTPPAELAAQLQRYVFRSKLALQPRDDLHASGCFAPPAHAAGAVFACDGDALELDMGGDGGARTLRLSPAQATAEGDTLARWDAADLCHGLPRLPPAQAGQWTPQQLSLERLQAFSVKKGCYPGQEIVARTHFLGQVKRGIALFEAASPPAIGAEVRDDERGIGTIASVAGRHALAVLPIGHPADGLSSDGAALLARPLLGGLQR